MVRILIKWTTQPPAPAAIISVLKRRALRGVGVMAVSPEGDYLKVFPSSDSPELLSLPLIKREIEAHFKGAHVVLP
jgi:hypothetical protein